MVYSLESWAKIHHVSNSTKYIYIAIIDRPHCTSYLNKGLFKASQCTEVLFAIFLSGGFTTMAVTNSQNTPLYHGLKSNCKNIVHIMNKFSYNTKRSFFSNLRLGNVYLKVCWTVKKQRKLLSNWFFKA